VDRAATAGVQWYRRRDLPRDPPAKPLILSEVPRQRYDATIPEIPPGMIDNLPGHVATVTPISSRRAKTDRLSERQRKTPPEQGFQQVQVEQAGDSAHVLNKIDHVKTRQKHLFRERSRRCSVPLNL
jgi:hypothetical protein